jgi:hypothetical protein
MRNLTSFYRCRRQSHDANRRHITEVFSIFIEISLKFPIDKAELFSSEENSIMTIYTKLYSMNTFSLFSKKETMLNFSLVFPNKESENMTVT